MDHLLDVTMSFGERAAYAGRMLLIGMATVVAVLAILWGALILFRLCVSRKKEKPATSAAKAPAAPAAPAEDNGALIAAITAAVAATLAAEHGGEAPAFRVVSFKKINTLQK